jgi:predicted ATPase/DNA-binding SARP family transcriptional activator
LSPLGEEVPLRLALFGVPTIEHDGATAALPFERRGQLAAFLALKRSWVPRAELAALLWPDQPAKLAYTNLRKALFRLQSLPWPLALDLQEGAIRLAAATDVAAFEDALRDGREADAIALRRGELLAGFDDDANEAWTAWLRFERDRLRALWRDAVLDRLDAATDAAAALGLSARLLDADPLDEAAARAQIAWLARSGQVARAHQAYDAFARRLDEELGLAPGVELERLRASLDAPPAAPPKARPVAPSPRDDGFVGRSIELRAIAERLGNGRCRLLTLVGPGGVGKTRLARRALEELQPGFADGGAFVTLEDVATPEEIGLRLARELGVRPRGADAIGAVVDALRERHQLLVVDNFEQVASGAAQLQRMVDGCPRLTIVATSRVRLGLPGEWVLPVDGLPCPEAEDHDRIDAFDAARLFVQSARRVAPAFSAAAEGAAIVDICRQVEGRPLALELAAAWTRVLSCEAIAAELRRDTALLHAPQAGAAGRHAGIDVVFAQSWQLLGAAERDALARLSVFRGGFTAEAGRAVAGASLPVLGALVDKSLLRKDDGRLQMHALVQELASRRLDDAGARESTERVHAGYFQRLVAQARDAVTQGEREALRWLATDFENVRRAWSWLAAHGTAGELAASDLTLYYFCDHLGRYGEGLALLNEALASRAVREDRRLQSLMLARAAHFLFRQDRYAEAEASARQALEGARGKAGSATRLQALKVLGSCHARVARFEEASRCIREALELAPEDTDPHNAGALYGNLSICERQMGNPQAALKLSLKALALERRAGDVGGEAAALSALGQLYYEMGEAKAAQAHLREALALCERHGLARLRGVVLANLADYSLAMNALEDAEDHAGRAMEFARAAGERGLQCFLGVQLATLAIRRGNPAAARAELAASLSLALSLRSPSLQTAGIACFAELLRAQGEPGCAFSVLRFAAGLVPPGSPGRLRIDPLLDRWRDAEAAAPPWPGLEAAEMAQRIVAESGVAYAPLIAALRAAR